MSESAASKIAELSRLFSRYLTPSELAEVDKTLIAELPIWVPLPGPQTAAKNCEADILYYGGSAGGGKSDLLLGLALTEHRRSIIYRRESTQLVALIDRLIEIRGTRNGWNGSDNILREAGRQLEFGSCKDPGDEIKYQGRPHSFKGFDEITHFIEAQFRFLIGWLRTTKAGERCRVVCAGNPPTTEEGRWVIDFWGPWLDDKHPHPAMPGELRWFTTIDGKDVECPSGEPFMHNGELLKPLSRTFIPSSVEDNPFLLETGYKSILQSMPEPLRSQMLLGDFRAGIEDSVWQVIPTSWVEAAMARWTPDGKKGEMDSVGADIARGGKDKTVFSARHGVWYAPLICWPGKETPDGATAAGLIISVTRDAAPIHVDVIGVGGSVYDHLKSNAIQAVPINNAEKAEEGATDKASGRLKFRNFRAQLWWRLREMLDPKIGNNIALPPDPELKADLCAPMWNLTPGGILIESKEQIIHGPRLHKALPLGRSPDKGDAVVMCSINTVKTAPHKGDWRAKVKKGSWRAI